jgi:hypothetical protein
LAARARPCAARTRLFGLIDTPNGALRAPPPPARRSFAVSYSTPNNIYKIYRTWAAHIKGFFFPLDHKGYEIGGPLSPAPPIAASLILPAIFLGNNYVSVRPHFLVFSFFNSFWIFSFCNSLLFFLSFSISSYSSLLFSSYSSCN